MLFDNITYFWYRKVLCHKTLRLKFVIKISSLIFKLIRNAIFSTIVNLYLYLYPSERSYNTYKKQHNT
jgi:hypothetical protein